MPQENPVVTVRLRVKWWVRPYAYTLALFARMTGSEIDLDKFARRCRRGYVVEYGTADE